MPLAPLRISAAGLNFPAVDRSSDPRCVSLGRASVSRTLVRSGVFRGQIRVGAVDMRSVATASSLWCGRGLLLEAELDQETPEARVGSQGVVARQSVDPGKVRILLLELSLESLQTFVRPTESSEIVGLIEESVDGR